MAVPTVVRVVLRLAVRSRQLVACRQEVLGHVLTESWLVADDLEVAWVVSLQVVELAGWKEHRVTRGERRLRLRKERMAVLWLHFQVVIVLPELRVQQLVLRILRWLLHLDHVVTRVRWQYSRVGVAKRSKDRRLHGREET